MLFRSIGVGSTFAEFQSKYKFEGTHDGGYCSPEGFDGSFLLGGFPPDYDAVYAIFLSSPDVIYY